MRIGKPELDPGNGEITWSVDVHGLAEAPDRLWFRLPAQYADMVTGLADPAVIGLIVPAMHAGERIQADGAVTGELSHSLTHGYQHILEAVIPGLRRVALDTPFTVEAGDQAPGVATGFSAGVDSFAVLAEHYFSAVPDVLRLTHLTFFNVGSHNSGEMGRRRFRERFGLLAPVAAEIGLPFIPVDSNLDDFYTFSNYQQTYGPRNIAAASLLQEGIGRYFFAGSFSFAHTGVRRSNDTAFSDPISLPMLTTRRFRPVSHGNQYTRVEKTLIVADTQASHVSLNVCVTPSSDGRNCSQCDKCLRTELTLEIAGRLEEFRQVFDLDVYRTARVPFLDWVAATDDEFALEIRDQARRAGFRLPPIPAARARRGALLLRRRARTMRRRVRRAFGGRS